MDLIDRQEVLAETDKWLNDLLEDDSAKDIRVGIRMVRVCMRQMSAVQPEIIACGNGELNAESGIVRCKDCRYYQDNNGGYPHMNCKWDANETPDADDFCSGAERRTE